MKNSDIKQWALSNAWNLVLTFVAIITAFVIQQGKVTANELEIKQLKDKVAEYPSQDYFEEKFKNIDEKIVDIKTLVKDHINE